MPLVEYFEADFFCLAAGLEKKCLLPIGEMPPSKIYFGFLEAPVISDDTVRLGFGDSSSEYLGCGESHLNARSLRHQILFSFWFALETSLMAPVRELRHSRCQNLWGPFPILIIRWSKRFIWKCFMITSIFYSNFEEVPWGKCSSRRNWNLIGLFHSQAFFSVIILIVLSVFYFGHTFIKV